MAAGKPVVATRQGGPLDIVVAGETGLLVPPRDADALADAIAMLLTERERGRQMGRAGRARVQKLFTVERYVADMEQVYRDLI